MVKQRKEIAMPIRLLAALLLVIQVGTIVFIVSVLKKQMDLFKLAVPKEIQKFRRRLFALALVIFLGNIIPMAVGLLTVLGVVTRSATHVNWVSGLYSASNTLTLFFSALLIWIMYRLAKQTPELNDQD